MTVYEIDEEQFEEIKRIINEYKKTSKHIEDLYLDLFSRGETSKITLKNTIKSVTDIKKQSEKLIASIKKNKQKKEKIESENRFELLDNYY